MESSGKYLIKFFFLFFFPLLHGAADRIWVWGLHAQKDQKEEEECEGVGLGGVTGETRKKDHRGLGGNLEDDI